jgi:hypothetical protein
VRTLHRGNLRFTPEYTESWTTWPLPARFHYAPMIAVHTTALSMQRALDFIQAAGAEEEASLVRLNCRNLSELQPDTVELLQQIAPVRCGSKTRLQLHRRCSPPP